MGYAHLLDKYIQNSELSINEILERLKDSGIKIDRSYISKLRSGAKPPASEEVTRALAEITGGDPQSLINAGVIEKAPEEIKAFITRLEDQTWNMVDYLLCNSEIKQVHELVTHIQRANLQSNHIKVLDLEDKERFNIAAITRRFDLLETLSRETFSFTDKLELYYAVTIYFQKFNEIPMELFYSKYILQGDNLSTSTNQQNSGLILSSKGKESITGDELDFINSCLEAYRIQKAKWL